MNLSRRTQLGRGAPLVRRTRIRPVNPERRRRLSAEAFGERGAAVRAMACVVVGDGCSGPIEAAHVRSRGAGGGRRDLVPLCRGHHRQQHAIGIESFAARWGVDLRGEADAIAAQLDERGLR